MSFFDGIQQFITSTGDSAGDFFGGWDRFTNDRAPVDASGAEAEDDSVVGSIFDAIGKTLDGPVTGGAASRSAQTAQLPGHTTSTRSLRMRAGQSKYEESVAADMFYRMWQDRLKNYAKIERETGSKL